MKSTPIDSEDFNYYKSIYVGTNNQLEFNDIAREDVLCKKKPQLTDEFYLSSYRMWHTLAILHNII